MAFGGVNPMTSRRGCYEVCYWWDKVGEDEGAPLSEYATSRAPSGSFYAKEISSYNESNRTLGDVMYTSNSITIQTKDDIGGLGVNCLVRFEDKIWRVENISSYKRSRTEQFNRVGEYTYTIGLVR